MKLAAPLVLGLLAFTGCGSAAEESLVVSDYSAAATTPEGEGATTAELLQKLERTSDLGVGRRQDPAKTVGYAEGSTAAGESFLDGAVWVDHVTREDADNHFGTTLRLFNNKSDAPVSFEWRIVFMDGKGAGVSSLRSDWKPITIEAKRWASVANFATVRGAVIFKFEARQGGSKPAQP
ncbi:MAG TPA: DUF1425 domain-containing protein [Planctomycetota bacterium]|nr:DUF1425 domain-containing protein [Planctomycetota bacterium]